MDNIIEYFNDFEKLLKSLSFLEKYSLQFGVFVEDAYKTVTVNILNTDDTISEEIMSIGDIMYLTEYGSMMIPAKPILHNCMKYVSENFEKVLDEIICDIFENGINEDKVEKKLKSFANSMEIYVQSQFMIMANSITLNDLVNKNEDKEYLYDLKKLKNFIKCRILVDGLKI